jgi:hypothetical protein
VSDGISVGNCSIILKTYGKQIGRGGAGIFSHTIILSLNSVCFLMPNGKPIMKWGEEEF